MLIGLALAALATGAIAITMGALLLKQRVKTPNPMTPDLNLDLLSYTEFSLTSQTGQPVTRDNLLGGVTIVDFFFSNCQAICPALSRNLKAAQDQLVGTNVRFLSISVDPTHDTPEQMRAYAKSVGADPSRWTFASGDMDQVQNILTKGLLLGAPYEDASSTIDLPGGGAMSNITHPSHFFLVGPSAEVIALSNGLDPEQVSMLVARARAIDQEIK